MSTPDIITVQGYSARYSRAFDKLMLVEGGFVDDKVDRGGATKYGISLRFLKADGAIDLDKDGFADFDLDFDGDIDGADVRMLTRGDARYLYLTHFWNVLGCETFPEPLGEMLFDQGVNGGNTAARKLLQRAINLALASRNHAMIDVDGKIGPRTRVALERALACPALGIEAVAEALREAARERYRAIALRIPSQKRFLKGWLARADAMGRG